MPGSQRAKWKLVEGRPALIVIDIQAGTFVEKEIRAIAHMPGYADRMARARVAIDKARARGIPVIFIQDEVLDAMEAYEEASSIRPVPSTRHREI